jgi:hypothetical protein
MKRVFLILNMFALAVGVLATQSCETSSAGYRYHDSNRYAQHGDYNRTYYSGDPYDRDYDRGHYRSDEPSLDVRF